MSGFQPAPVNRSECRLRRIVQDVLDSASIKVRGVRNS